MKVLRKGEEKALRCFVFGLAVLAVFALFKFEFIGLLALVFVLWLFNAGLRQWEQWFQGKREKSAVRDALRRSWLIMPCSMV
jgi:hypothetical protein